jgi:probable F420-dependent oxidoreductase
LEPEIVHLGLIVPNYGEDVSPDVLRTYAEAAEEHGFDSIWASEHIVVTTNDIYGHFYDPFLSLAWLAAHTERVRLGTSIVLVPLHHPIHLAKQVVTLQELCGGRFLFGVGMGWREDEYQLMGVAFEERGKRGDDALRLMHALWTGERSYSGEFWSFENATFAPRPKPVPEIWTGGGPGASLRRALEFGGVWHPTSRYKPERVKQVKEEHPELPVVPRTVPAKVDSYLEVGVDGVVVAVEDVAEIAAVGARYRS